MKGAKRICVFLENRIYDTCGGVAEWFKATVLKTVLGNTNVGSNPTATFSLYPSFINEFYIYHMMDVENRHKKKIQS